MHIKVEKGTRPDIDLCQSCSFATIASGAAGSQQIKRCSELEQRVPFPVNDCSSWNEKGATSLWEMQQIAWAVEVKGDRAIGFLNPKQRREKGDPDVY